MEKSIPFPEGSFQVRAQGSVILDGIRVFTSSGSRRRTGIKIRMNLKDDTNEL